MNRLPRLALAVGAVLLLAGGTAMAVGIYETATHDCQPGHQLYVSSYGPNESAGPGEAASFEGLTTVEQQIFLDALVAEDDSSTPRDWSRDTFHGIEVVTYRGEQYRVTPVVKDCFGGKGPQLRTAGKVFSFVGVALALPAVVWRRSGRVRGLVR